MENYKSRKFTREPFLFIHIKISSLPSARLELSIDSVHHTEYIRANQYLH